MQVRRFRSHTRRASRYDVIHAKAARSGKRPHAGTTHEPAHRASIRELDRPLYPISRRPSPVGTRGAGDRGLSHVPRGGAAGVPFDADAGAQRHPAVVPRGAWPGHQRCEARAPVVVADAASRGAEPRRSACAARGAGRLDAPHRPPAVWRGPAADGVSDPTGEGFRFHAGGKSSCAEARAGRTG